MTATNQSGEVERLRSALREALEAIDVFKGCYDQYGDALPDGWDYRNVRAVEGAHEKGWRALATQPATSQEGEREALRKIRDSGWFRTEGDAHAECVAIATLALAATPTPRPRPMVTADLYHTSPHAFPEDCWSGGRTECRRCGIHLNSIFDDVDGCRGPWWMRCQDPF